jgi:hypothetical protein
MRGVLTPTIAFWVFGSPGGFPSPIFGNVSGDLTLLSKWGCDRWAKKTPRDIKLYYSSPQIFNIDPDDMLKIIIINVDNEFVLLLKHIRRLWLM